MSRLRPEELAACRAAFSKYDTDRCGRMSNWDLKGALTAMGWKCSDGDIFRMLTQLDGEASTMTFEEFMRILEAEKQYVEELNNEADTVDAFVACGGQMDKSGTVNGASLVKLVEEEFGLEVDMKAMVAKVDRSGEGALNYAKFKKLLSTAT